MAKRNLSTKDILEKEFKPAIRGFNMKEVDEFLDKIIRDYESFEKEISYLKNELDHLDRENKNIRQNKPATAGQNSYTQNKNNSTTNYDILKRISKLERAVFGTQKVDDLPFDSEDGMIYEDAEDSFDDTVIYHKD